MKRYSIGFGLLVISVIAFLIGCGSGASDDLAGPAIVVSNTNNVTLTGYVRDGSLNSARTSRLRFSLGDLSGITVFLEDSSYISGITDYNGKYTIPNVPQGKHTLVAEKRIGNQIQFRARQENISVVAPAGISEVELPQSDPAQTLSMQQSNYSLNINVTDSNGAPLTKNQNQLSVLLWGHDYAMEYPNSNVLALKDFPSTIATATITANGYEKAVIPVEFGENCNSDIYVKLAKKYENVAPIVAISYNQDDSTIYKDFNEILTIKPNRNLDLRANGFDANGDSISYQWYATSGSIRSTSYNSASFVATETYASVTVTLIGTDSKGAFGKAELLLSVYGGKATDTPIIATDTPIIATDTPIIATDTPIIATDTPIIATDTPIIATDTPIIATDTPIIATDTPIIATDTPIIATDTPDIGSGTPDIGSGTPDIGSGTPDIGSGTPDIGSGTPDIGSGTPDIGSGTPDIGSGTPDIGSGTPDIGSGTSDIGSGTSRP